MTYFNCVFKFVILSPKRPKYSITKSCGKFVLVFTLTEQMTEKLQGYFCLPPGCVMPRALKVKFHQ